MSSRGLKIANCILQIDVKMDTSALNTHFRSFENYGKMAFTYERNGYFGYFPDFL